MADCVIVLKSGVKVEAEAVNWDQLITSLNQAFKLGTSITFITWDNMVINLNEIATIYKKGTGIKSD